MAVVALVAVAACGGGGGDAPTGNARAAVATVAVAPGAATTTPHGTVQLAASARDAAGATLAGRATTWRSDPHTVATVSEQGLVTGVAPGRATITATSEGQSGSAVITVTPTPVATVVVTPPTASLTVGQQATLTAEPQDAASNPLADRGVAWSSSNPNVAIVSAGGVVSAVAPGVAMITAASEGRSGAATISVSQMPVASVRVTPGTFDVSVGRTVQLTAEPLDAGGNVLAGRVVRWSSSSTAVATVSASGLVTGVAPGAAIVYAESEGHVGGAAVQVTPAPPAFALAAISAGGAHTCAVSPSGAAYCWGGNADGQLGTGTGAATARPARVTQLPSATHIAAGTRHTCALTQDGTAYCWGANEAGQLGTGDRSGRSAPTAVAGGLTFKEISAGDRHTCAVATSGVPYCWGANEMGQLGIGSTVASLLPAQVLIAEAINGTTADRIVAGGAHSCARSVYILCWGDNAVGQLGTGPSGDQCGTHRCETAPVRVAPSSLSSISTVTVGPKHTCAIAGLAWAYCWGDNSGGQVGNPSAGVFASGPMRVFSNTQIGSSVITAGGRHSCVVVSQQPGYPANTACWGRNDHGQLGTGVQTPWSGTPVYLGRVFAALSGGAEHTCAIDVTGAGHCWGRGDAGQLGTGDTQDERTPAAVMAPPAP